jgi:hypothetical protein
MTIISTIADGTRKVFSIPPYTGSPVVKVNGTVVTYTVSGDNALALSAIPSKGSSVDIDYRPVDTAAATGLSYLVSVSGSPVYGGTLTATLASGWTATSYQWIRDGQDIAGATTSTYVLGTADIGKRITVRVSALANTGDESPAVSYTGAPLLRLATAFNKFPCNVSTPTTNAGFERRLAGRSFRPIGSTSYKSLRLSAYACAMQESDRIYSTVTPMRVVGAFIECNGVSVPVTWGGVANPEFAAGAYDQVSDPVYPEQFGLTSFARNRSLYVRGEVAVGNTGRLPNTESSQTESSGFIYSSENSQLTNLSGTGGLTFTGTGRTSAGELPFIVIGEQVDIVADAATWIGYGDSIFAQGGDWSYFQTACRGDTSAYIAGCAVAKVGGTFSFIIYGANEIGSVAKYANRVVDEMHTNSISGIALGSLQTYAQDVWAFWRARKSTHPLARAFRVIRAPLGVRTSGSWGTLAAQTMLTDWDAGGKVELLNDWFDTRVGQANGPDYVCTNLWSTPFLVRGGDISGKGTPGANWYKWPVPGYTGDGLHPSNVAAAWNNGLGANLRSHMLNAANL